jgi:hypothetical protein
LRVLLHNVTMLYPLHSLDAYLRTRSTGLGISIGICSVFGGMQLMVLGIIGLYLGKLFMQAKNRPNYIVRSTNLKKVDNDLIKL